MKTSFFFAAFLALLAGAGCGSKSSDPAPDPNAGIDPTTAILRTWKKTRFVVRTDKGEYNVAPPLPKQWETLTFSKDGTYTDGGLGLNGTYSFKENNTKLVLVQNPSLTQPGGFTYVTFPTFQGLNALETTSVSVAVNPEKVGANAEEQDIARVALGQLGNQTAINGSTVKTVQIFLRFEAQ